jgi:hypothetical protein
MSKILTLQDAGLFDTLVNVSEAYGWSGVPCHRPGIETVNGQVRTYNGKRPLVVYERYRDKRPSRAQYREWEDLFATDAGPPNWAFITGHSTSGTALYVIDTDTAVLSPWLQSCGTTTIKSGREGGGWHTWLTGQADLYRTKKALELPDGSVVRFQGVEGIIVLPGSVHASGNVYRCLDGYDLDVIKDLSTIGWLAKALQTTDEVDRQAAKRWAQFKGYNYRQRCLASIMDPRRAIREGDCYDSFWIAYWLLQRESDNGKGPNTKAYAEGVIRERNKLLESPLSEGRLRDVFNDKSLDGMPGCGAARTRLSWISSQKLCWECKLMETHGGANVLKAMEHGLGTTEQMVVYTMSMTGETSPSRIRAAINVKDNRTVKSAMTRIMAAGCWPDNVDLPAKNAGELDLPASDAGDLDLPAKNAGASAMSNVPNCESTTGSSGK